MGEFVANRGCESEQINAATNWKDLGEFNAWLVERLTGKRWRLAEAA